MTVTGSEHHSEIDWAAAAESPEMRDLAVRRRRFVVPATIGFLAWYLVFVGLAGYAPGFMGESVYEGLTVGYVLALSQFAMVWGLALAYTRRAERHFDPLAERVAARAMVLSHAVAIEHDDGVAEHHEGRLAPEPVA